MKCTKIFLVFLTLNFWVVATGSGEGDLSATSLKQTIAAGPDAIALLMDSAAHDTEQQKNHSGNPESAKHTARNQITDVPTEPTFLYRGLAALALCTGICTGLQCYALYFKTQQDSLNS